VPLTASACIGCGDTLRMAPCDGRCDERLSTFAAAEDVRAARAAAALVAIAERLAGETPPEPERAYAGLRRSAAEALALGDPVLGDDPVRFDAWWCAHCTRLEAPQECLGICIRRPLELVDAAELDAALPAAARARGHEAPLRALARLVLAVTPREGQAQRTWAAFRAPARAALGG
jgi:hypothetical protein